MAHDNSADKIQTYIYDKIFRREFSPGQPINQNVVLDDKNLDRYNPNWRIMNDVRDAMERFPKYTLQQYKDYFKANFHVRFTRYFLDWQLKQDDIPVSTAQAQDTYIKLWGQPRQMRHRGLDPKQHGLHFQENLLDITKKIMKKYPTYTIDQYIAVIESEHKVLAENLVRYIDKWKHIKEDKTFNNDKKAQNPFTVPRTKNKRRLGVWLNDTYKEQF